MGSKEGERETILVGIKEGEKDIKKQLRKLESVFYKLECYVQKVIIDHRIGLFRITVEAERPLEIEIEERDLTPEEYADQTLYDLIE
jgi:hypothetical protein